MRERRNDYDITNRINTTDSEDVAKEIVRIYQDIYQREAPQNLSRAFADLGALYRGEYPGFYECDTDYHDIQHVLDVTLGMARLLDGCVRATGTETITEKLFRLGIVTALYHDCGYIRHRKDTRHEKGAEYTAVHVSRGAHFLEEYLPKIGMKDLAQAAARTVHFTGYEVPVDKIKLPGPEYRLIGNLLGSADILAQMADRCYLEKCYDRLYPEFVLGGIARKRHRDGREEIIFSSAADLIFKTPRFYQGATKRLQQDLGGCYSYVERHFNGQNLYFDELKKNIDHAKLIAGDGDISRLRRRPPKTIDNGESAEQSQQPRLI
jgi:hypothetical protein